MATVQFQVGKTYNVRSICDSECIFSFKVVARSEKTITLRAQGKDVRRKVRICSYDNCELVDPLGRYSMSPVLRAV